MDMNYDDEDERSFQENEDDQERDEEEDEFNERLRREYDSEGEDHVPPPHDEDEYEYDDDEEEVLAQQTDKNILSVLKRLEEISQECGDIASYKKNTRELFEQLLLKLEENNDQIYSLHHRIKYLEQECESKDVHIEKITIAMQEAVDDCRVEAEELVEDMSKKVATEVTQRREIERIVCRLQGENSQLQETLRIQTLPGLEKNLDQLIAEIKVQETKAYQENIQQLQSVIRSKDKEFQALKAQRETEMGAMVAIIKAAQQKIDLFQHQMKVHAQTLAMYREREEKAKRSPVLFMHPPAPGNREVFVSEADTLSQESPKNSSTDTGTALGAGSGPGTKKSFHDNGKSVVPYRKKNSKKKKGAAAAAPGSGVGTQQKGSATGAGEASGGSIAQDTTAGAGGQQESPPAKDPKKKKGSSKASQKKRSESLESESMSMSPSASNASLLSSSSAPPQASPSTASAAGAPAAVEHREKTSVFWSNIRLSL